MMITGTTVLRAIFALNLVSALVYFVQAPGPLDWTMVLLFVSTTLVLSTALRSRK